MIKILFVEDDLPLALGIEYTLKQEGFDVIHAKNLNEAREQYKNNEFNIILLDVMLPDGSGYEFCKEVRVNSEIPIIFMTACDEEGNVVMGLDMGGDDYITKPIRVKELVSRINAVLRRKRIVSKKEENSNKKEEEKEKSDIDEKVNSIIDSLNFPGIDEDNRVDIDGKNYIK